MSRLFYTFPISLDPSKFMKMELVDDDNLGTMIAIYINPQPVKLFNELTDVESVQNVTLINQNYGFHFDLNGSRLEIHPEVIDTYTQGEEGSDNDGYSNHNGEDFSNLDLDEVSDAIDDEGA
ncbi:hypothetical protein J1N35_026409 [Gossypium stocksii]|uniref:Uncharacterized protein n=1 Tax=Gossypium stocksii TaxID=47602 RepID=A0A9D3V982_9ROSI|nr:hypothetical protein J1N35_026409 [Gossypium stocksii]